MSETPDSEYYWIARAWVDVPGHTDWDHTEDVSEELAEARRILDDSDPASREGRAAAILDKILDGVPEAEVVVNE